MCVCIFSHSVISGYFIYSSVHQFQSFNLSLPPYLLILNSYLYETENSYLANWITGKWYNAWLSFSENRRHKTSHVSVCFTRWFLFMWLYNTYFLLILKHMSATINHHLNRDIPLRVKREMSSLAPEVWSKQVVFITLRPCGCLRSPMYPRGWIQTCRTCFPAWMKRVLHFKKRFHPFAFHKTYYPVLT